SECRLSCLNRLRSVQNQFPVARRVAPIGVATTIGWSCNFRTLRHVIEMRTEPSAEEEIRLVFSQVYDLLKDKYPNLLGDYEEEMVDGLPWVKTVHRKV
ncbi:MAG TPA: hypothetical protein EYN96_00100, partial [Candidatus Hydrogenedentes bacterium]|nr:hypothetical protein [Candidatus Hydrogenedentota bacterium]